MSWHLKNYGLPLLPGNTFQDLTKSAFHRSQSLGYKNGYALKRRPIGAVGQDALVSLHLTQQEMAELVAETTNLTYGSMDWETYKDFVPAHVALDKKVLRYFAYFVEEVTFSPAENLRVRPVVIYYYLEDDTMSILEPRESNSGMPQGERLRRQRFPKNEFGQHYNWRDLNLGMDLKVYGIKYRITQCDAFTREFMESEGMVVSDPELVPADPHSKRYKGPKLTYTTPSTYDQLGQFLAMDRKVLRFYAVWDNSDFLYGEELFVIVHYYLADDTVEVREVHHPNNGRDPFPVVQQRSKLPKEMKPMSKENFPSCVLEVSKAEVSEYHNTRDFQLGQKIKLMGRSFLLYDCDDFTKEYYQQNHPDMEMKPVEVPMRTDRIPERKKEIPPYNGYGSLEDSLQNCFSLFPKPPRTDVLRKLESNDEVLRYSCLLDSPNPDDDHRRFILTFHLADDMISIFERATHNSGVLGGKFLTKTRVPKPGSSVDNPDYYTPADLAIGATLEVFSHRFVLTDADRQVLTYMTSNPDGIPSETLGSIQQRFGVTVENNLPPVLDGNAAESAP